MSASKEYFAYRDVAIGLLGIGVLGYASYHIYKDFQHHHRSHSRHAPQVAEEGSKTHQPAPVAVQVVDEERARKKSEKKELKKLEKGDVVPVPEEFSQIVEDSQNVPRGVPLLKGGDPEPKVDVKLLRKQRINHDSFIFTFSLPEEHVLGVPVGHHISIYGTLDDGKEERATYTPISNVHQDGHFDVLIKVYYPCPEFPKGGRLTQLLDNLDIGSSVTIGGPRGKHMYLGKGYFRFSFDKTAPIRKVSKFTFLAGGSGITPFLFIVRHLVIDPEDKTEVTLVFSNKTRDDVLLHQEFAHFAAQGKIKYIYTITREEEVPQGALKGRISQEMLEAHIPPPSEDHLVFYCGPKGFNVTANKALTSLGHHEDNVVKF